MGKKIHLEFLGKNSPTETFLETSGKNISDHLLFW